jgi:N,N'-diacetyllegionaminate synthase
MANIEIIAEVACIHEGEKEYIYELIREFKKNGATAIKFQCFDPNEVVSHSHPDYEYLKKISFSKKEWLEIFSFCNKNKIKVYIDYSGNFSIKLINDSKKFIYGIKINSSEMQNRNSLNKLLNFDFPLLISCSGSSVLEIIDVLDLFSSHEKITLMHGYQSFPKNFDEKGGSPKFPLNHKEQNLNKIKELKNIFPQFDVGLSDHIDGSTQDAIDIPSYAIIAGATVIEKHVVIDRKEKREDYFSALGPKDFLEMVKKINRVREILGPENIHFDLKEFDYIREMKKNLVSKNEIKINQTIDDSDVIMTRDGNFENSLNMFRALNKTVNRNIKKNHIISNYDLQNKIGIFCNARVSSSRLKDKALLPFYKNWSTLGYLLNRLKIYDGDIGHLVLATTSLPEDEALVEIASKNNIDYFKGSSEDVMGRMVNCAEYFGWDIIVRVTGDDQFVSCESIEEAIAYHKKNNYEFTRVEGLPVGMSCEIIEYKTIKKIHNHIQDYSKTEHLTWFLDNDWICKNGVLKLNLKKELASFRLTLDYNEDYELMKSIAKICHKNYGEGYIESKNIFAELLRIKPKWKHNDNLWTLKREDINTSMRYIRKNDLSK